MKAAFLTLIINELGDHANQHVIGIKTIVDGLKLADSAALLINAASERTCFARDAGSGGFETGGNSVLVGPLRVEIAGLSVEVTEVSRVIRSAAIQRVDVAPQVSSVASVAAILAAEATTGLQTKSILTFLLKNLASFQIDGSVK